MAAIPKNKVGVFTQRIVLNGAFDLKRLYETVTAWYGEHQYTYTEGEMTTKRKVKGNELKMKLNGDRKITDYVRFNINILVLATFLEKVDVGGKRLDRGLVEIRMTSFIDLDYYKKFQRSKTGKFLQFIYHNYLIKERIQLVYWQDLYNESMELFNLMKESMELEAFA